MKDLLPKKEIEDALRRHGAEGEDAFYAVAAYYLQYYKAEVTNNSLHCQERGEAILQSVGKDLRLITLLEQTVSADPEGLNLPVWYQHFLGRRFRLETGKFFTPRPVAAAMARLLPLKENAVIMDPTCGGGTFLVEASKRWKSQGCLLVGNDVDRMLVDLTEIVLSIGAPTHHKRRLMSCNIYDAGGEFEELCGTVDDILANPPFSLPLSSIKVKSKLFSLGYRNSDALFIDLALHLLKPGGRLVCLLPHALIVNREYEKLRRTVEDDWDLLGVITLPEGVFHLTANTTTRADVVILKKRGTRKQTTGDVVFCHAPSVGVPLNSRSGASEGNALRDIVENPEVLTALDV
jgi:type I restriction-modification system DNA methylase subunit